MKRIITIASAFALIASLGFAKSSKLTIKNTVGSDLDELGEYDMYAHTTETDINGDKQTNNNFALGDQLQADFESTYVTARLRLEGLFQNVNGDDHKFVLRPSGFVHVTPLPNIGIIAGNNFYKYFAIPSAYLAAADDTTKYGRLLNNSVDRETYIGSDSFSLYGNGFAGGLTTNWTWGEDDQFYLKAAAGGSIYTDFGSDTEKTFDFGINAGIQHAFDLGFTAHEINSDDRKFGAFAGLTSIQNLILNAGFYYNFTPGDYLPEARVSRKDDNDVEVDKFKKQSTKYALGASAGYYFNGIGLGIYGDFITGLNNEYIGEIKYYDSNGNLTGTKTTTIVRGESVVKYKNGEAKRTDEYTAKAIPLYSQLHLVYDVNNSFSASFNFKVRTMIGDSEQRWLTFYPKVNFTLPGKLGAITAGLRLDMNNTRYDGGLSSISIPFTYTYKFKKKF
ncbi:MAG: hypothetical protein IJS09_00870 [Treponema sp.]|nr:hypothetical protein [Treponema sp.]